MWSTTRITLDWITACWDTSTKGRTPLDRGKRRALISSTILHRHTTHVSIDRKLIVHGLWLRTREEKERGENNRHTNVRPFLYAGQWKKLDSMECAWVHVSVCVCWRDSEGLCLTVGYGTKCLTYNRSKQQWLFCFHERKNSRKTKGKQSWSLNDKNRIDRFMIVKLRRRDGRFVKGYVHKMGSVAHKQRPLQDGASTCQFVFSQAKGGRERRQQCLWPRRPEMTMQPGKEAALGGAGSEPGCPSLLPVREEASPLSAGCPDSFPCSCLQARTRSTAHEGWHRSPLAAAASTWWCSRGRGRGRCWAASGHTPGRSARPAPARVERCGVSVAATAWGDRTTSASHPAPVAQACTPHCRDQCWSYRVPPGPVVAAQGQAYRPPPARCHALHCKTTHTSEQVLGSRAGKCPPAMTPCLTDRTRWREEPLDRLERVQDKTTTTQWLCFGGCHLQTNCHPTQSTWRPLRPGTREERCQQPSSGPRGAPCAARCAVETRTTGECCWVPGSAEQARCGHSYDGWEGMDPVRRGQNAVTMAAGSQRFSCALAERVLCVDLCHHSYRRMSPSRDSKMPPGPVLRSLPDWACSSPTTMYAQLTASGSGSFQTNAPGRGRPRRSVWRCAECQTPSSSNQRLSILLAHLWRFSRRPPARRSLLRFHPPRPPLTLYCSTQSLPPLLLSMPCPQPPRPIQMCLAGTQRNGRERCPGWSVAAGAWKGPECCRRTSVPTGDRLRVCFLPTDHTSSSCATAINWALDLQQKREQPLWFSGFQYNTL